MPLAVLNLMTPLSSEVGSPKNKNRTRSMDRWRFETTRPLANGGVLFVALQTFVKYDSVRGGPNSTLPTQFSPKSCDPIWRRSKRIDEPSFITKGG